VKWKILSIRSQSPPMKPANSIVFWVALCGRLGAFESYLVYYIVVVLKSSFDTMEAVEKELDRAFSFTLGNLLREFRKYRELSLALDRRFDAFKTERDWLCHSIYRQNHTDLLNGPRFEALIRRLHTFKTEATALSDILDRSFDDWRAAQGITQDELDAEIKRTLDSWKGA
jgi:hypothetical protein